jgi:hypothetical protein
MSTTTTEHLLECRLLPLTSFDEAHSELLINTAFVLDAKPGEFDVDRFRGAVERVVDKWRMLAGEVVWSEEVRLFVPLSSRTR